MLVIQGALLSDTAVCPFIKCDYHFDRKSGKIVFISIYFCSNAIDILINTHFILNAPQYAACA